MGSSPYKKCLTPEVVQLLEGTPLTDIAYLHEHTSGGGSVAKRVGKWVSEFRGTDAEERLNQKSEEIDRTFK